MGNQTSPISDAMLPAAMQPGAEHAALENGEIASMVLLGLGWLVSFVPLNFRRRTIIDAVALGAVVIPRASHYQRSKSQRKKRQD